MVRVVALVGVIGISFSAIFVRLAAVAPMTAAVFRGLYALPLLAVGAWALRHQDHRPARSRLLAVAAGLVLTLDLAAWHRSISLIGAGPSTVLANTQVVFIAVIAWILYRERPTATALVVIPIVLAGVLLLSGLGQADTYGDDPVTGVILGTAAGAAYSVFLLVFRQSNRAHLAPAPGPLLDVTIGMVIGSAAAGLFDPGFSMAITWPEHGWLIALAVVSQTVGWLLISTALPRLAALETSVLLLLQPAGTLLWGRLVFGEDPSTLQWVGVVLVLGGVAVAGARGTVRPAPEPITAPAAANPPIP